MNQNQFTGYGGTLEDAINAAAASAMKTWKSPGPDAMARLKIESMSLLYGGLIGHVGTRVVTVSLPLGQLPVPGAPAGSAPAALIDAMMG